MRLSGIDLRQLKVFDAVVRHGGFAAAQIELNISPSTISNHITALEQRLGVSLCQRGRGGFRLSDKGRLVFVEFQKLLRSIAEFENFSVSISAPKGRLIGKIKIGLLDAIATDKSLRLEQAFAAFLAQPNDIQFEITQHSPQELQQRILNGSLDVGIGSFPHKVVELTYQLLYSEVHSLYCGAAHPLFSVKRSHLKIESLHKESVVGRGYWPDRQYVELGFKNVKTVVYAIEPQLILIRSGKFIGYLPDHFAVQWVKDNQLRCLSPPAPQFNSEFDLVFKKGLRPSQALSKFLSAVLYAHGAH